MQIAEHELTHDEGIKRDSRERKAREEKAEVPEVPEVPKNTITVESAGFDGRLFPMMFVVCFTKN